MSDDPGLAPEATQVITRSANEGIPIAAIARIVQQPFDLVEDVLQSALLLGQIAQLPKGDWPPGTPRWERFPSTPRCANAEDINFACRKAFRLTSLEAGFMVVLLTRECADKDRLHAVIENQRLSRQQRPDSSELTDPKMVDVMICKLRKKLKAVDPRFVIVTSWGKGYYFEPDIKQAIFGLIGGPYATGEAQEATAATH